MVSEAVRAVFGRATNDAELDKLLWADPESAGRAEGLSGPDLFELVGRIRSVRRSAAAKKPQLQVLQDIELRRLGRVWPFAKLDSAGLQTRADLGARFATELLVGLALGNRRDDTTLSGLESWARALEDEVRSRADAATVVDLALADALVDSTKLRNAVDQSRSWGR